jgi:sterol desaturase/sphingolipid hydroxylase (fatty acid hydroxylase superfamily)
MHRQHHTKAEPQFLDTYEGHWLEGPFQGAGMLVPFTVYNYSALDLLLILVFLNARGMLRHDPRGIFLVGNHHLIHHKHPNYNYGEQWLDFLGGTTKTSPAPQWPPCDRVQPPSPPSLASQDVDRPLHHAEASCS